MPTPIRKSLSIIILSVASLGLAMLAAQTTARRAARLEAEALHELTQQVVTEALEEFSAISQKRGLWAQERKRVLEHIGLDPEQDYREPKPENTGIDPGGGSN